MFLIVLWRRLCEERLRLEYEHVDFLVDQSTLNLWAGKSLQERCQAFNGHFPDKYIKPKALWNLYIKFGIRRKKICEVKRIP